MLVVDRSMPREPMKSMTPSTDRSFVDQAGHILMWTTVRETKRSCIERARPASPCCRVRLCGRRGRSARSGYVGHNIDPAHVTGVVGKPIGRHGHCRMPDSFSRSPSAGSVERRAWPNRRLRDRYGASVAASASWRPASERRSPCAMAREGRCARDWEQRGWRHSEC